jgi:hypothetical protein
MGTTIDSDIQDRASAVAEVSGSVSAWLADTSAFLGMLQETLQHVRPTDDAGADVNRRLAQLPVLLRQCRSQIPTPEMIQTWVSLLAEREEPRMARMDTNSASV